MEETSTKLMVWAPCLVQGKADIEPGPEAVPTPPDPSAVRGAGEECYSLGQDVTGPASTDTGWLDSPVRPEAAETLKRLKEILNGGVELSIIVPCRAFSSMARVVERTFRWLRRYAVPYDEVLFLEAQGLARVRGVSALGEADVYVLDDAPVVEELQHRGRIAYHISGKRLPDDSEVAASSWINVEEAVLHLAR